MIRGKQEGQNDGSVARKLKCVGQCVVKGRHWILQGQSVLLHRECGATRVFKQGSDRISSLPLVAVLDLGCSGQECKRQTPKCSGFSLHHGESRSTAWI